MAMKDLSIDVTEEVETECNHKRVAEKKRFISDPYLDYRCVEECEHFGLARFELLLEYLFLILHTRWPSISAFWPTPTTIDEGLKVDSAGSGGGGGGGGEEEADDDGGVGPIGEGLAPERVAPPPRYGYGAIIVTSGGKEPLPTTTRGGAIEVGADEVVDMGGVGPKPREFRLLVSAVADVECHGGHAYGGDDDEGEDENEGAL
ncbi:hypothetical protein J437_LFUL012066 [Ladona fulva]|uniref:Uncharacterized protein n=1 Tax=Ladona fulva TaxID=123851 RepID=A0A8K0KBC7_LADFU|nr:hypothetical protein J437_LFUL012066 [Ladona fulva]